MREPASSRLESGLLPGYRHGLQRSNVLTTSREALAGVPTRNRSRRTAVEIGLGVESSDVGTSHIRSPPLVLLPSGNLRLSPSNARCWPKAVIRQPRIQPDFDVGPLPQLQLPHATADPDLQGH